jgi:uncharacterized membrane protein
MARRCAVSVDIAARASKVWSVLTDVEEMPSWTASMVSVSLDPQGALAMGSQARILQPKLSETVWTVTELTPGESFTWVSHGPGITTTASHLLEGRQGGVIVHLTVTFGGPGAFLAGLVGGKLTQTYLQMEANGLKAACERR